MSNNKEIRTFDGHLFHETPPKRKRVYDRDGNRCLKCGNKEYLTLDHIKPKSKGGKNNISNLQTLCAKCNGEKDDTEIDYRKNRKMQEELKLNDFISYLPFGLKCRILNHKCDYVGLEYSTVNGYYFVGEQLHLAYTGGSTGKVNGKEIEVYLRPLSELRGDTGYVWIDILRAQCGTDNDEEWLEHGENLRWESLDWTDAPYHFTTQLIKLQFDVFGLIEKGLAKNINTLNK